MQDQMGRRTFLVGVGAVAVLAACSGDSKAEDEDEPGGTTTAASGGSEDTEAEPPRRVLLLGEEYLLADTLALGIVPVASTATVADVGFIGVDDYDTSDIQVLENTDQDLESLVAL
ncbi:MAG TPA: hypothetical protein VF228_02090, partial [Iamia sp.]